MSVFLFILKIIGIILLSILGLLLFLLLLVLFVPIRYKGTFDKDTPESDIRVNGYVSYLLHIVSIRVIYEEELTYYMKIFGFKLGRKSHDSSKAAYKTTENKDKASTDDVKPTEESVSYSIDWNGEESYEKSQESDEESRDFFDKIDDFIEKLIEKKDSLCEKYSKAKKKYRYWSKMLADESNKSAASDIYRYVRKLIRKYIPYKCKGKLNFGFDDPATTGSVLMYLSIFYPILPKGLEIVPDFENDLFYGNALFKGRIRLCHIAALLIKLIANRKVRRLWKLYKKHP